MKQRKTVKIKTSLCSAIACLLFCFPSIKSGSIKDITKPYLGEYECKSATLGSQEYMQDFAYIKLELLSDNTFCLHYKTKDGQKGTQSGTYVYDQEQNTITFSLGEKEEFKRCFPLEKGALTLTFPVGTQTFRMEFQRK